MFEHLVPSDGTVCEVFQKYEIEHFGGTSSRRKEEFGHEVS